MRITATRSILSTLVLAAAGATVSVTPAAAAVDVRGDFNGDGRSDLVISAAGEDLGAAADTGAVHVLAGTALGVRARGSQFFHQDTEGFPGANDASDALGAATASGDFDQDGYDDLAIGAPGETVGAAAGAGQVTILMGSPFGLGMAEAEVINQDSDGVAGVAEAADAFGAALAAGDFDGDGRDDLAVGAPGEALGGAADAGIVHVFSGTSDGLAGTGSVLVRQETTIGTSEAGDRFGETLAAGDFDADSRHDLVVGAPGEDSDAGAATVVPGSAGGVVSAAALLLAQDVSGVPGASEAGDNFADALASGDFDGDGDDDLAIGSPGEAVGALTDAGALHLFAGSEDGVAAAGSRQLYQGSAAPGLAETGDAFASALVSGDFDDDGRSDLAVGVPGESFAGFVRAGQVLVLRGSAVGINAAGSTTWTQDSAGIPDVPEADDRFGIAAFTGDYNGDGRSDLAVGSFESIGALALAGGVHVVFGSATGLGSGGAQFFSQDSASIPDSAEALDAFGVSA